jgi:hypothetical protein
MIDYKYPTIASGATPIGSAERTPDRKKESAMKMKKATIETVRAAQHLDNYKSSTT